ncbi:glyoxylase-like metal-dependent hydrolase (beta-lactamase superfamily II) [Palleronia aestuarii]|uniref:Glyoxylase-like metal-dependent hydrolase (Beta-lactamase superfamily II) n=1 Tax=Palleronia aestuarii TaxID=568105 RepID=A0A2W7NH49_9RHOB|nr:MBL fold metallo-hydrolase [Palleronia aestuarii]PZX19568.1 glyoxylase-like metal-dependent hydrolase (beta-lactamase superfamily II) [Palleronia aestuarii]
MTEPAGDDPIRYPFETPPEHGVPRVVAPGVEWVRLPLPMALDHVNCWVLEDAGGVAIVDTGFDTKRTRALWEKALGGRAVTRVIVTHHHPDHVGLAGWFRANGAELFMSRTAWLMARMLQLDVQDRPSPEAVAFWKGGGMEAGILAARLDERPFNFADVTAPLPLGFTRLVEGDSLSIGGRIWRIRMGAGHAPEHATLWSETDDLVLGGDQLLPSISPNLGVYPTEPEADPVADWLAACTRLAPHARPEQLVLPGHKLPFRGLPARMRQLAENHHGALARLEAHLSEPRTAAQCFAPLFKRRIGSSEYGLALVEAMAHCLHLWHVGRVVRREGPDGAWLWQARGGAGDARSAG